MRLLHIIATVNPTGGGPVEGIYRQDNATRAFGSREIVCLDAPTDPWVKDSPVPVHALGARRAREGFLGHYGYSPDLIPWLRANVSNYDAVIVNGLWNYATFAASRVLPGSTVPYFVFTHGMLDPWFREAYPLKNLAKHLFWQVCEGPLMAGAESALFTTEEERELARDPFIGHRFRETVVGYGTAPAPPFSPAMDEAFRLAAPDIAGRPYLLFLSRIHPKKGVDLLIEAFARVSNDRPELQLVIAGPDQTGSVAALKARVEALGLADRVHWPGMLLGDAKWGAFYGSEAFVLPSHQENFGIVVAEALGCGRPVLITDKINIWREVRQGGAGLVASDDAQGVETLLQEWFALPARGRAQMRKAAEVVFREHFDVRVTGPAMMRSLQSALAR